MNPIFATSAFWQPYLTLEPDGVSEDDLAAQLEGFRRDFRVRQDTIESTHSGRRHTSVRRVVEFSFACGDRFSLEIEYEPDIGGCSATLFLTDDRSGTKSVMGWSDLAQWHPYCLRPVELDCLLRYWARWDERWNGQDVPLLLLCQFVGLPDAGACDALAARARAALQSLGLPGAGEEQFDIPLHDLEGDYRWEEDVELGWVFTSDEYCCYSTRNRPHLGSEEKSFPFVALREMMEEVQQRLDRR